MEDDQYGEFDGGSAEIDVDDIAPIDPLPVMDDVEVLEPEVLEPEAAPVDAAEPLPVTDDVEVIEPLPDAEPAYADDVSPLPVMDDVEVIEPEVLEPEAPVDVDTADTLPVMDDVEVIEPLPDAEPAYADDVSPLPVMDDVEVVEPSEPVAPDDLPRTGEATSLEEPPVLHEGLPVDEQSVQYREQLEPVHGGRTWEGEPPGVSYNQGQNRRGFQQTCGPSSGASMLNMATGTSDYTEDYMVECAVAGGHCDSDQPLPEDCGGTTPESMFALLEETRPDSVAVELNQDGEVPSSERLAELVDSGATTMVAVHGDTLWKQSGGINGLSFGPQAADHWVLVHGAERAEDGSVVGYHIVDSGGGMDYVDAATLDRARFGGLFNPITKYVATIVSQAKDA